MSRFSRRAAAALSALLMAGTLTACGSTSSSDDDASGGPWSFKSGNGETVKLDTTPKRIIASGAEAAALISFGIRPVGIYAERTGQGRREPQGPRSQGHHDPRRDLGRDRRREGREPQPRPDRRRLVARREGLQRSRGGREGQQQEARQPRPDRRRLSGQVDRRRLPRATRTSPSHSAPTSTIPRSPRTRRRSRRRSPTSRRPSPTSRVSASLAVSPADDLLYVANPKYAPELLDFQRWGLDVINPDNPDKGFPYWENLSWENADKYQPDLLLIDDRTYDTSVKTGEKQPTWNSIKAGQGQGVRRRGRPTGCTPTASTPSSSPS